MASFSLRSQRTGNYKEFTLLELLKLFGDSVNDEIWLEDGEDVYNLSSFREIGGGGSGSAKENWSVEEAVQIAGQDTFYLKYIPTTEVLLIILNGIIQTKNKDFTMNGREVKFPYRMGVQDAVKFIYQF